MSRNLLTYAGDDLQQDLARARARMPGPPFRDVLGWIHEDIRPSAYVEIGVHAGESLRVARPGTVCIGIDPEPVIEAPLNDGTTVYAMTSNEFFVKYNLAELLGVAAVPFTFIDGLHLSEQTIRDFVNMEPYTGPQSVIAVHDCLPLDARTATRERQSSFYSGDVWKILVFLKRYRPSLRVAVIPTMPTGLAIVSGFRGRTSSPDDVRDVDVSDIVALPWDYFEQNADTLFEVIANERDAVRKHLCSVNASQ